MQAPIWYANVLAIAALLLAMALRGAGRSWPWLAMFLAASLVRDLALVAAPPGTRRYFWTFAATEPLILAALAGAVLETWRRRTARLVSVGQAGYYLLAVGVVAASLATAATVAEARGMDEQTRALLGFRQWILLLLAVFTLAGLAVLELLHSRALASVQIQHRFVSAYLALRGATAIIFLVGQEARPAINTITLGVGTLLYAAWAWAIRPVPAEPAPQPGPRAQEVEARVAEMLATLRATAGRP